MQSVGAAWLMTSLTSSTTLVGLVQTAATLPVFLVGLVAGALADLADRKALLLLVPGLDAAHGCHAWRADAAWIRLSVGIARS